MTAVLGELDGIELESGVSAFTGEPFVVTRAVGTLPDGTVVALHGQMDVARTRDHGAVVFAVAEAAVQDAALLSFLKSLNNDEQAAMRVIVGLRQFRADRPGVGDGG